MIKDKISLEFKNDMSELERLQDRIDQLGEILGLSKKSVFQLNLAMEEVFCNIVSYGYRDKDEHSIKLAIWSQKGILNLCIEDDGVPFNPTESEPPNLKCPIEERRVGGLGCHLMKCYMDDIIYERTGNRNILTMKKALDGERLCS